MYADDGCTIGHSEAHAAQCTRKLCSGFEWLGSQDAKCKRRQVSQRGGPWAGGVVFADKGLLRKFLSKLRWDKLHTHLDWMLVTATSPQGLENKRFRQARGFCVYASMTYDFMQPFLKGMHLTADGWRPDRDAEGWKKEKNRDEVDGEPSDEEVIDMVKEALADGSDPSADPRDQGPEFLRPVPRLMRDLKALKRLLHGESPIMVPVRAQQVAQIAYGFGDASGEGFGSAIGAGSSGVRIW